ncbi:Putative Holin-X, holin superfamily III [Prosthecobacter debontii]|uniref:Putative Holin-X, holin superfamily III n=1 Tax=Prosthecobacter debontii TaxID=48467 RepID=A0A1T4YKK0_9BACT|nr:phage holin family protein [Prosthecobacter debontii]SKB02276.1 Putative Holin-X, holin superfamily III [Prosthecobacter debontii]
MMDIEVSRVRSLLRALALYAEARGHLFQIEAREAGVKLSEILVLVAVLIGCLLFGWMLALPALVWVVAETQGLPWWKVALWTAGGHLLFAFIFFISLKVRLKKLRVFEETFHQFRRDREWIGNNPHDS